jgi:hypothetical protein
MKNRIGKSVAALGLGLALASGAAFAERMENGLLADNQDKGAEMLLDLAVVRPLELVGYVAGFGAWVVSLPFTIPSESVAPAANELVGKPFEYTFMRPLGNWHQCGSDRHPC